MNTTGSRAETKKRWRLEATTTNLRAPCHDSRERKGSGAPHYARGARFVNDPHWRDLVLFYEYFHGDTGRGVGASHQTGWTSLVVSLLESVARGQTA